MGLVISARNRKRLLWGGLAAGCLAFGYGLGLILFSPHEPEPPASSLVERDAKPWFELQPPPPQLVEGPNEPIFPETGTPSSVLTPPPDPAAGITAYEEPLPQDPYLPASPPPPAPFPERMAWLDNAVAYADPGDRPMMAIVIDDLGIDHKRTERIIKLKAPLTLSFLTYAVDLVGQARRARGAGHELLLHVGMQPKGTMVDPGPDALLAASPPEKIRARTSELIGRLDGIVGINNHMGSLFTENRAAMTAVLSELRHRGLLFLDSRTSPQTVGAEVAHELGVPVVERNVFLDNTNRVEAVWAAIRQAERIAAKHGFAVVIGHPRDATLQVLEAWLADADKRGVAVVPLSAIVKRSLRHSALTERG